MARRVVSRGLGFNFLPSSGTLTLEQLADYMAHINGLASRDEWIVTDRVGLLGFAPLH
jgi:hypothetical protein